MTPTRGELGSLSAHDLLGALAAARASGTLVLTRGAALCTVRLGGGEPGARAELGGAFDFGAPGGAFAFWPHPDGGDAWAVPSRYPDARGPLGALPALGETPLLSTAETNLRALVGRLQSETFGGALALTAPGRGGLLLFQEGRIAGAVYEGSGPSRGDAALRALVSPQAERLELTLHALPGGVVAALLGLLLGLRLEVAGGVPEGFSGLELTPGGARFYAAGSPYLVVSRPHAEAAASGLFAPSPRAPGLNLPSEPHGFEGRFYSLTLRGRDALNPMTELAMRFRGEFGRTGQRALEQFRTEGSVEAAAAALSLDLSDLRPTVERLHTEGFLRATGEPSPTPSPRLR